MTAALADEEDALAAALMQASPAPLPIGSTAPAAPAASDRACVLTLLEVLGEADLLPEVPADVPELLRLLPRADLYVQDEVQLALHPTLTRCWQPQGRAGQRRVRAPGNNQKCLGFGAVDWRDGGLSFGFSPRRDAETFCLQLDELVARSAARGRSAIVLADNARTHRPDGSRLVRATMARHGAALRRSIPRPTTQTAIPSNDSGVVFATASRTIIITTTSGDCTPTPRPKSSASRPIRRASSSMSAAPAPSPSTSTQQPNEDNSTWKHLGPIGSWHPRTFGSCSPLSTNC